MAPRVVRPRSDSARWPAAAAVGAAALALGFFGAARVFRPPGASASEPDEAPTADETAHDGTPPAGEQPTVASVDAGRVAPPPVVAPRVGVRVMRSVLQSCGDGEELTTPGAQCGAVPGLEGALAEYLPALGNCPAAEQAAAQRDALLSIGLRVDFTRHRVTALPGRSSSVRDPLTYVACARTALEHTDAIWQLHAPKARYLYFFAVRFGPVRATGAPIAPAATPTAISPAPTPVVAAPTAVVAAPTPVVLAPTPSEPATTPSVPVTGAPLIRPENAQVVWQSGLVRDAPRAGAIVAHLAQGTTVTVVARHGTWWQVRVAHPAVEGWIYGEAIGR